MPRKKKESRRRIDLPAGYSRTELKVIPENWERAGASIKTPWQIWYRFFEPGGAGKLVTIRGMNHLHTLAERRDVVPTLIAQEEKKLAKGWHPIRRRFTVIPADSKGPDYIIDPATPLPEALQQAFERLSAPGRNTRPEMVRNIRACLKYFIQAVIASGQDSRPVEDVKRRHMVMIWEELARLKKSAWSANAHNYYRAHIKMLFEELYRIETIEVVPMASIEKKQVDKKERRTLTEDDRRKLDKELKESNYRLWRLVNLFFHSGARTTEFLNLRRSDVDTGKMQARYEVFKGRTGQKKIVYRPIKEISLPLWQEVLEEAKPSQYLFSDGLKPGPKTILREQISRRWKLWVKDKLGIEADWYSLKHLNATEVREQMGTDAALAYTGHTSEQMLDEVYDVKKAAREADRIRKAGNTFAPARREDE